jgi:hypothetical protein
MFRVFLVSSRSFKNERFHTYIVFPVVALLTLRQERDLPLGRIPDLMVNCKSTYQYLDESPEIYSHKVVLPMLKPLRRL